MAEAGSGACVGTGGVPVSAAKRSGRSRGQMSRFWGALIFVAQRIGKPWSKRLEPRDVLFEHFAAFIIARTETGEVRNSCLGDLDLESEECREAVLGLIREHFPDEAMEIARELQAASQYE